MLLILTLFSGLIFTSCFKKEEVVNEENQDHMILSVLWFQRSSEMRALFIQGYNIASERVINAVRQPGTGRPMAVVTDLDEAMLDNSPYQGWQLESGEPFTDETWKGWTDMEEAKPLPGALEFTRLADSLNVEVFYVSNRTVADAFESTISNLKSAGFPYADEDHVFLKDSTSSKVDRRNRILETHDIILLIGDNLGDFDELFEDRSHNAGFGNVDSLAAFFGRKYIVLPNPMYGSWLKPALFPDENLPLRERMLRSISKVNIFTR